MNTFQRTEDRLIEYIPTDDGEFEKWADKYAPEWQHMNRASIEMWRAIWEAAKDHYSGKVING